MSAAKLEPDSSAMPPPLPLAAVAVPPPPASTAVTAPAAASSADVSHKVAGSAFASGFDDVDDDDDGAEKEEKEEEEEDEDDDEGDGARAAGRPCEWCGGARAAGVGCGCAGADVRALTPSSPALIWLSRKLSLASYAGSFSARAALGPRTVTLLVGPPNSGKSYFAFAQLARARTGAYLAPLRLLALEGRDALAARGVACDLLTGEDVESEAGATHVSSTIEMLDTQHTIDCAVIDEAQQLFDPSRGWAWTTALVGAPARELFVICAEYAVEAVTRLLAACGEAPALRRFERKQALHALPGTVTLDALERGDAIVCFGRADVLVMRDAVAAQTGAPVAVVYGSLPSEVRRFEAERFASGAAPFLVATDAIGMGLNLPIRRVLFFTLGKFDGAAVRELLPVEVQQIAGRAGRFGFHEAGFVGCLDSAGAGAPSALRRLLAARAEPPRGFRFPVAASAWHVRVISRRLRCDSLADVIHVFAARLGLGADAEASSDFVVADASRMLGVADFLDQVAGKLPIADRFTYACAPVSASDKDLTADFLHWAAGHANAGCAGAPRFLQLHGRPSLDGLERALRCATLWLFLSNKFGDAVYPGVEAAIDARADFGERLSALLCAPRRLAPPGAEDRVWKRANNAESR